MESVQPAVERPRFGKIGKTYLKQFISSNSERVRFSGLELISEANQPIQQIGCICSGTAALLNETDQGEVIRSGYLREYDYFGIEVLFGKGYSLFNVLAVNDVECCLFDKKRFLETIRKDNVLKDFFEDCLLWRLKQVMNNPQMSGNTSARENTDIQGRILDRAIQYIDTHYSQNISLNDLARVNCLSRYYLSRKFKEETGYRFKDYLNIRRLSAARKLLALPDVNISEACFSVGFNDLSYFARVFKKYVGVTPSVYKKEICGSME